MIPTNTIMHVFNTVAPVNIKTSDILKHDILGSYIESTGSHGAKFTALREIEPDWSNLLHNHGLDLPYEKLAEISTYGMLHWYTKFLVGFKISRSSTEIHSRYDDLISDTDPYFLEYFNLVKSDSLLVDHATVFSRIKVVIENIQRLKAPHRWMDGNLTKVADTIQSNIFKALYLLVVNDRPYYKPLVITNTKFLEFFKEPIIVDLNDIVFDVNESLHGYTQIAF